MKPTRILLLCAFLLIVASATSAAERGLYFNVKFGDTDAEASVGDVFDAALDGESDSRAYELGWRLNNFVAFQVGYHDLGDIEGIACLGIGNSCGGVLNVPFIADTVAYSLAFVPQLLLTRSISIFGKIGVVALESEVSGVLDNSQRCRDELARVENPLSGSDVPERIRILQHIHTTAQEQVDEKSQEETKRRLLRSAPCD